jgi:pimeloyl-ACP methyl ester carboxylesterase
MDVEDIENRARAALQLFMTPRRLAPREWEAALLQRGTRLTFANGLVARSFGAGTRVLLLHGWEGRGMNLGMFIPPLTAAGYQVIALDGPAHGESPGEQTNPADFAQGLCGVGQELGPLAGMIAHSMGAASTALALRQGLVSARVVLIAGPSSLAGVLRRFAQAAQLPEPVAERFSALVAEHVGKPAEMLDIAHVSATLTTPALIIHDPADADVPFADAQAIAASWPDARLYVTEGLGHRRILRDRDVIAMATSFITADVPSAALLGSIA